MDSLDLAFLFPRWHEPAVPRPSPGAVHLRRALEDLGPTFMKLGQVLSTRPDLVPPGFEAELALLQDAGPIVPTHEVRVAIEAAFGRPTNLLFEQFDDVPIAAASIGQVHAATLADGRDVVVKVRRPGVIDGVTIDLDALDTRCPHRRAKFAACEPLRPRRTGKGVRDDPTCGTRLPT